MTYDTLLNSKKSIIIKKINFTEMMKMLKVILITTVVLSVVNIIIALLRSKKAVPIINGILYGVVALALVVLFTENAIISRDYDDYKIEGYGLFGGINYERTEKDEYIFSKMMFLSLPSEESIPKSEAKISPITKIYKPVTIYYDEEGSVAKIVPNYSVASFFALVICSILLFLFNAGAIIVLIAKRLISLVRKR